MFAFPANRIHVLDRSIICIGARFSKIRNQCGDIPPIHIPMPNVFTGVHRLLSLPHFDIYVWFV